jgi:hypothetical protein
MTFNPAEISLWSTLHDGTLEAVESDVQAKTVTLRFDVLYVRDFHLFHESTRFIVKIAGIRPDSSTDIGRFSHADLEVSNATLISSATGQTLRLGLLGGHQGYEEIIFDGQGITFHIGELSVHPQELVALGEAYWEAWAKKRPPSSLG